MRIIKQFLINHRAEIAKFMAIGVITLVAQLALQHIEAAHGYNVVRWTVIQGSVLGTIGMALNKVWTFRHRELSWAVVFVLWNLQRIPHFLASTAMFLLLYSVMDWSHTHATVTTAAFLGVGSFFMAYFGSMREIRSLRFWRKTTG